jgi:hypothetical protein
MTKSIKTFRLSIHTQQQLTDLSKKFGASTAEIVTLATDHMYREEFPMNTIKITMSEQDLAEFLSTDLETDDEGKLSEHDANLVDTREQQYINALAAEMRTYSTFDNVRVTVVIDSNALNDSVRVDGDLNSDEVETEFNDAKCALANRLDEFITD